jgi:hypothetical protein
MEISNKECFDWIEAFLKQYRRFGICFVTIHKETKMLYYFEHFVTLRSAITTQSVMDWISKIDDQGWSDYVYAFCEDGKVIADQDQAELFSELYGLNDDGDVFPLFADYFSILRLNKPKEF